MQNKVFKIIIKITLVSFVFGISFFWAQTSLAGMTPLTVMSDTFERLKVNEFSNQTIQFTTTTGVINGNMMEIDYPAGEFTGFGKVGLGEDDVEVKNITTNHVYTDAGSPGCGGAEEIYVNVGADVIRLFFCPGNGGSAAPGDQIIVYVGAFTTETVEDGNYKLLNPVAAGTKVISLYTGPWGLGLNYERGALAVSIIADDRVEITATVDPTFTFTISSNVCGLGTLTTGAVATCNYTLAVGTNATSGAKITIQAITDGTNALLNGDSVPANDINDIAENSAVSAGTEGYGIALAAGGAWTESGDFNDDDTPIPSALTEMLSIPSPVLITDTNTVTHRAAISPTSAAGTYTQTVQYIATGTF